MQLRGQTLFLGMVDPADHAAVAQIGYSLGYIVRPARGARVPDGPAALRLLRRRRALAPHRHARRQGGGPPADPRPRRGRGAHRRRRPAATRWWRARSRSATASSAASSSSSCASRGCWAGAARRGCDRARAAALRIPLDLPSVFRPSRAIRRVRRPPRPGGGRTASSWRQIGKKPGTNAAVFPVTLRARVVNLMCGDQRQRGRRARRPGGLIAPVQKIPRAYLRIIRQRSRKPRASAGRAQARRDQGVRGEHDREDTRRSVGVVSARRKPARPASERRSRPRRRARRSRRRAPRGIRSARIGARLPVRVRVPGLPLPLDGRLPFERRYLDPGRGAQLADPHAAGESLLPGPAQLRAGSAAARLHARSAALSPTASTAGGSCSRRRASRWRWRRCSGCST